MSAFALLFVRQPMEPDTVHSFRARLDAMLARLRHRGPDGCTVWADEEVLVGHLHDWRTPEDVGEVQPLVEEKGRWILVFDGRLDNRAEVLRELNNGSRHAIPVTSSDACIVLQAYVEWGPDCFGRFVGPYALVLFDRVRGQVICSRDAMGLRTLFYHLSDERLVVASEEQAVLEADDVSDRLDETTVAAYLALRAPSDGRTFFADVRELLPAHTLAVGATTVQQVQHWQPDLHRTIQYRKAQDYWEHFRSLLYESVKCRSRSVGDLLVAMSGGLDSTSVAAMLVDVIGHKDVVSTISFGFDRFPSCDERARIKAFTTLHNAKSIHVLADGDWPLRNVNSWPHNPNACDANAYRLIKERLYREAQERGYAVLLTGMYGDNLYMGSTNWLLDLVRELKLRTVAEELLERGKAYGWFQTLTGPSVRRLPGYLLDKAPLGHTFRPKSTSRLPVWLTSKARTLLEAQPKAGASNRHAARPWQWRSVSSPAVVSSLIKEQYFAHRYGIETRHPYRDRRLVDFMLSVPAHQLTKHAMPKYIVRQAMGERLPAAIRDLRVQPNSLEAFYKHGIGLKERETLRLLLHREDAMWPEYVNPEYLKIEGRNARDVDTLSEDQLVLLWKCASLELWNRQRGERQPIAASKFRIGSSRLCVS